jgi:hypothetical protein
MQVKKFMKLKKENLIIIFLNGQILHIKISLIINSLLNVLHKPKYDFWVH